MCFYRLPQHPMTFCWEEAVVTFSALKQQHAVAQQWVWAQSLLASIDSMYFFSSCESNEEHLENVMQTISSSCICTGRWEQNIISARKMNCHSQITAVCPLFRSALQIKWAGKIKAACLPAECAGIACMLDNHVRNLLLKILCVCLFPPARHASFSLRIWLSDCIRLSPAMESVNKAIITINITEQWNLFILYWRTLMVLLIGQL